MRVGSKLKRQFQGKNKEERVSKGEVCSLCHRKCGHLVETMTVEVRVVECWTGTPWRPLPPFDLFGIQCAMEWLPARLFDKHSVHHFLPP